MAAKIKNQGLLRHCIWCCSNFFHMNANQQVETHVTWPEAPSWHNILTAAFTNQRVVLIRILHKDGLAP